jgi:hypothetical protein
MPHPKSDSPSGEDDSVSDTILLSDADLENLEAEIPILAGLRMFAEEAVHMPWFSKLGMPLDREAKQIARDYLDALGFPDVEPVRVGNWEDAADAALSLDYDTPAWEQEESLRSDLMVRAQEQLSEDALSIALAHVSAILSTALRSAARDQAALWDIEDEGLSDAMTGAALAAAHGAALALIVDEEKDHPLHLKFALFARGRWPISVAGMSFNLF